MIATHRPEMLIGVSSSWKTTVLRKMVMTSLNMPATDLDGEFRKRQEARPSAYL